MTRKRRWTWIGLALVLVVAGSSIFVNFHVGLPEPTAYANYRAILSGMSRIEVHRLMQGAGTVMYTAVSNVEIMHIDGRFMIAVVYEPDPTLAASGASPASPPQDDWVAKEKAFVELGSGDRVDNILIGLGARPQRMVDRDRMPR